MAISQHAKKAVRPSGSANTQTSGHKRKATLIIGSMKHTKSPTKSINSRWTLYTTDFTIHNLTSKESQELHNDVVINNINAAFWGSSCWVDESSINITGNDFLQLCEANDMSERSLQYIIVIKLVHIRSYNKSGDSVQGFLLPSRVMKNFST